MYKVREKNCGYESWDYGYCKLQLSCKKKTLRDIHISHESSWTELKALPPHSSVHTNNDLNSANFEHYDNTLCLGKLKRLRVDQFDDLLGQASIKRQPHTHTGHCKVKHLRCVYTSAFVLLGLCVRSENKTSPSDTL